MKRNINATEAEEEIIKYIKADADWDDLVRVYRASIDENAELEETSDGYSIVTDPEKAHNPHGT